MTEKPLETNESQRVVVVQAPASKLSPIAILVIVQAIFMVGVGVWVVMHFNNQDAKDDSLTKEDVAEMLKAEKKQNSAAQENALPGEADEGAKGKKANTEVQPKTRSLKVATDLPRSIRGDEARYEWHTNGVDFFAIQAIQFYRKEPSASVATLLFVSGDTIDLKVDSDLPLSSQRLRVKSVEELAMTLDVNGRDYRMRMIEGMSILHDRPIHRLVNPNDVITPSDVKEGEEVDLPPDIRDVTGLPEGVRKRIEEWTGEKIVGTGGNEADAPSNELEPIVWVNTRTAFEPKWERVKDAFLKKTLLVVMISEEGPAIGAKIVSFHATEAEVKGEEKPAVEGLLYELENFGFLKGDVIQAVDGRSVNGPREFREALKSASYQDGVVFRLLRSGKIQNIEFEIGGK